ncbi:MAG: hypothetical protein ACP5VP_08005 [Candidatus Limnocylindrales bacterium]
MSSNIGQNYPYTHETEPERAAAVERACAATEGLRDRIAAEATPLPPAEPGERWWVWVCPVDGGAGRLHVAGYARDRHALYAVCDHCGKSFLR